MTGQLPIPDLLEQYMEETAQTEQWITVQEFRSYFQLDESVGQAISGFLRRINHGPYATCRFRVSRIEKVPDETSPHHIIGRYRVERRPEPRKRSPKGKAAE